MWDKIEIVKHDYNIMWQSVSYEAAIILHIAMYKGYLL